MWNKKNIAVGIMFAIFAIVCALSLLQGNRESYNIIGTVVFVLVSIAFLKRARK